MVTNNYNKLFFHTILFTLFFEIFSLFGNFYPIINTVCFFVILGFILILSLENIKYGLYFVIAELIIGSQGHLFSVNFSGINLSIRIGIFLVIMSVWLLNLIKNRDISFLKNKFFKYYAVFFVFLVWGFVNAILNKNSFSNIFFDINGYFYFAYIFPFFSYLNSFKDIYNVLKVSLASLVMSSLKVVFLLYVFSHEILVVNSTLYKWVRDTRIGEITKMQGDFYRIFFQSQIYNAIAFFAIIIIILGSYLLSQKQKQINKQQINSFIFSVLMLSSVLLSLSRSFWVGCFVGAVFLLGLFLFFYKKRIFSIKNLFYLFYAVSISTFILVSLVIKIPFPQKSTTNLDILKNRAATIIVNGEAAVSSRWNLLPPLLKEIQNKPLLGHGFGKTITYTSSDPRILNSTAGQSGKYTTYAFEWGYLDMWLKLGIIGVFPYIVLLLVLLFKGLQNAIKSIKVLNDVDDNIDNLVLLGLFLGFIVLIVTNIFTPYLNHPLGIGYILFFTVVLDLILKSSKIKGNVNNSSFIDSTKKTAIIT